MKYQHLLCAGFPVLLLALGWGVFRASGVDPVISRQQGSEMQLTHTAPAGSYHRVEFSDDLRNWTPLATLKSTGTLNYTDSSAPYAPRRHYRFTELTGTPLTGEHLQTSDGLITFHPVNHASFVMQWKDKMIYSDPVGASSLYTGLAKADLILVTHSHSDHFSGTTLDAVRNGTAARIIAPQAPYNSMTATLKGLTSVMLTGQTPATANSAPLTVFGITVEAIPAYNSNHPLGTANAYLLTIGGKRLFISGDTGNTPEMRALTAIDAAFVCMNVPFTMTVPDAVAAVRAFKPRVCYPYHFRNSTGTLADLASFKSQTGSDLGIEVRIRTWY